MALEQIEMFRDLTKIELAKLLGKLNKQDIPIGTTLFRQGDAGDCLYIIESGKLDLFSAASAGIGLPMATLGEGSAFGEMALLTGEARTATAIAATDLRLYVIDRETFDWLITEQAALSRYFIRLLSKRLMATNERLHEGKGEKAQQVADRLDKLPEPVAHMLLWCAEFPRVSRSLIRRQWSISLEEQWSAHPEIGHFLHVDGDDGEWVSLSKEERPVLAGLANAIFGYAQKKQWTDAAVAFHAAAGDWAAAADIYADKDEWAAALDVIERAGDILSDKQRRDIRHVLDRCPLEPLTSRYAAIKLYIPYCLEDASKAKSGLSIIENALNTQAAAYSPAQLASLYEWGADLCNRLNYGQQALEYLKLAEWMAVSENGAAATGQADSKSFGLAKQKLARNKSQLQAENAGKLANRSGWAGIAAIAAALFSIGLFYWLDPFAGLSRHAMIFVGVAIAAVILWIVNLIPDYIVALGMLAYWVLGGLVDPEVALSGFSSTTWLYMVFIMALSAAITKSGILYRVALNALKRFPPRYRGQLMGIVAAGSVLNPLIPSSSAKVALGVPIARTLAESMGFADNSRGAAGLGMAAMLFYGFTAPFVMTGSYTNMMAYGLSGAEPVAWLQWFLYALPAFVLFSAILLLMLLLSSRGTQAPRPISVEVLDEQLRLIGPLSRGEIVAVSTVLGAVGLMMLQPLHGIDSTWVMLAAFVVLVLSGTLDRQTISTDIDWTFVLFLGIAFSFAGAVSELGIADALSSYLGAHMTFFLSSPYLFISSVIVICFLVTLIVRDDPAVILLVAALLPLASAQGIHPWVLVFVILLCTDPFFFAYQSPTYLAAYYSSEGKTFTHRQGQLAAFGYALAVVAAVLLSIPYWQWLGLIGNN
ncbi:SLC13 family permease [Paenibacillus koleovorans]|uniref:SLC13 family permease n=1 Tax=Paenibacillus koleovorans TaxID=121608 RepID=UPI000FDB4332|nr:SLC13 family permease [Paenibacillus koleovorans]